MYLEDRIEQLCRELKCKFKWENGEEIEITLPGRQTYPNGSRYKLFNIEMMEENKMFAEIKDYLELCIK